VAGCVGVRFGFPTTGCSVLPRRIAAGFAADVFGQLVEYVNTEVWSLYPLRPPCFPVALRASSEDYHSPMFSRSRQHLWFSYPHGNLAHSLIFAGANFSNP